MQAQSTLLAPCRRAYRLQLHTSRCGRLADAASRFVEPRLNSLEQRVMLLVGGRDLALPSASEGERLVKRLQRGHVKVGHVLLGTRSAPVMSLCSPLCAPVS